jgi:hypothetical protein
MKPITIKKRPIITLKYGKNYKKNTQKIIGGTTTQQVTSDKLVTLNNVFNQYSKIFNSDTIPVFANDTYYVQFMPYDGRNENNPNNYKYPYIVYYVDNKTIWQFNGAENVQVTIDSIPNKTHIYKLDDISQISFFKSLFYLLNKNSTIKFSVTDGESVTERSSIKSTDEYLFTKNVKGFELNKVYNIKKYNKLWVTINNPQIPDQKFSYNYITYKPPNKVEDISQIFQVGFEIQLIKKDKKMFGSNDLKVYKINKIGNSDCTLYYYNNIKNDNDFTDTKNLKTLNITIDNLLNKYKLFIPYFFVNDIVSIKESPNKTFKVVEVLHYGYIKVIPEKNISAMENNIKIYNCNDVTKIEDNPPLSNDNIVCTDTNQNYIVYVKKSETGTLTTPEQEAILEINKNITIDTVKTWINNNCDEKDKPKNKLSQPLIDEYNEAIDKVNIQSGANEPAVVSGASPASRYPIIPSLFSGNPASSTVTSNPVSSTVDTTGSSTLPTRPRGQSLNRPLDLAQGTAVLNKQHSKNPSTPRPIRQFQEFTEDI